jgi:CheY-like chemotaxis protein
VTRKTLLVDDDPSDVELALTALTAHDLADHVVVAWDGVEALDCLYRRKRFADRDQDVPRVILLDLKMPRMNGLEVLRQIKGDDTLKELPVVMLTSSRQEQDLLESYALGVNAYVIKPVEFGEFSQQVGRIGQFWALANETLNMVRGNTASGCVQDQNPN